LDWGLRADVRCRERSACCSSENLQIGLEAEGGYEFLFLWSRNRKEICETFHADVVEAGGSGHSSLSETVTRERTSGGDSVSEFLEG